ncbi:MAG TPA: serine/threonine-protein kinase [Fimbriiglobus sp.]|nr:serine/threonine-protein kinase [Fimbriiglobus sp.]
MLIGQHVGPFEIESEIGSGAMGTVYQATWHKDGQDVPVALKVIALGLASNEGAMARFEREANILKQLRHPHIVRLYATGRYKQTPFIAMEHVNGEGLDRVLGRRGKMGWEDVVGYAKQLCEALQHAHEKGIIHRDLKPSNLMVTPDGRLKLTDFGIAKDTDVTSLTGANSTIGTAAYMSPEQCKGDRNLTAKSDLYSLGIVLYELVTGRKPFTADTTVEMFLKHVNETPIRPGRLVPDLPVWLDNLIMFLLEKERERRPLDAATVGKLLGEIEEKVSAQQSVGAEVANARRVDRPLRDGKLDESDKDLARSLRATGKKRKKKQPGGGGRAPVLLKAGLLVAALVVVVGLVVYALWPEGIDAAYARVRSADPGAGRKAAAAKFLDRFRGDSDPRVAEVREVFKAEAVRGAEDALAKRYAHEAMRSNSQDYNEEAYRSAMLAIGYEQAGQLLKAEAQWSVARDKSPAADPNAITDVTSQAVLKWVAEKRLRDLQEVRSRLDRVHKQIERDRLYEVARTADDPLDPERAASRGLRLDELGDKAGAKAQWQELAALTEKDFDRRVWYLLAKYKDADLGPVAQDGAARAKRLDDVLTRLEKSWSAARGNPEDRVTRRTIRNGCRDVIDLYGKDESPPIQALVARAQKLLDAVSK